MSGDGAFLKPHHADEDNWTMKLGKGVFHSDCSFVEDVKMTGTESVADNDKIRYLDNYDQCSLHREALGWLGH